MLKLWYMRFIVIILNMFLTYLCSKLLDDYFLRNAFSSDDSYKKNANELSKYTIAFEGLIEKVSLNEIAKLDIKAIK